jgi:hypothetical protein
MKCGIIAAVALGILACADAPVLAQAKGRDAGAARFGWLSTLEEGKAQARGNGKPLMVVLRCVP